MAPHFEIGALDVIGYATVLNVNMLPSIVPPVFAVEAQQGRVLLPPFVLNDGYLWNSTPVTRSEAEALRRTNEITLFDKGFPARAGYELWIDQTFEAHYQPRADTERELRRVAADAIERATHAMRAGDFAEAERLSSVAISADDRRIEPLAIKAAIRRHEKRSGERVMAELASRAAAPESFSSLVDTFAGMSHPTLAAPNFTLRSTSPLRDVAKKRGYPVSPAPPIPHRPTNDQEPVACSKLFDPRVQLTPSRTADLSVHFNQDQAA